VLILLVFFDHLESTDHNGPYFAHLCKNQISAHVDSMTLTAGIAATYGDPHEDFSATSQRISGSASTTRRRSLLRMDAWTSRGRGRRRRVDSASLPKYSLRKESWGGIFVYGPTQAVYQTDDEAYCLLLRLKNGENLDKVRLSPGALNQEIIDEFENTLKQLGVV
jgi:siroheme synthase (precorrin-2 oxidase/ferrochelatase)